MAEHRWNRTVDFTDQAGEITVSFHHPTQADEEGWSQFEIRVTAPTLSAKRTVDLWKRDGIEQYFRKLSRLNGTPKKPLVFEPLEPEFRITTSGSPDDPGRLSLVFEIWQFAEDGWNVEAPIVIAYDDLRVHSEAVARFFESSS